MKAKSPTEQKWEKETAALRAICLDCGLVEEVKWGKPCYTLDASNVVLIQGFKDYCALMFCKGALLKDPKGILHRPGENTQAARQARFTELSGITAMKPVLKTYIQEAIAAEKQGLEINYKGTSDFPVPEELRQRMREDRGFKEAFEALTPGRQRGYLIYFGEPKQSKTREARIDKYVEKILKGKGLHDWKPDKEEGEASKAKPKPTKKEGVVLLSGGNPQIAKGDGDEPVRAYIAAMPGWKREIGERLDALIVRTVPGVAKAVRWNSPFYGVEGRGFFLSFHVLTRYVKVTFFAGMSLKPVPPGGTERSKEARWIDIYEEDELDEAQMTAWIRQAAALPGWKP